MLHVLGPDLQFNFFISIQLPQFLQERHSVPFAKVFKKKKRTPAYRNFARELNKMFNMIFTFFTNPGIKSSNICIVYIPALQTLPEFEDGGRGTEAAILKIKD